MSKKGKSECPVCQKVLPALEMQLHVNKHFYEKDGCDPGSSSVRCHYPECHAVIFPEDLTDHNAAHELARQLQYEEQQDILRTTSVNEDEILAQQLQMEEQKTKEDQEFRKLQEKYGMIQNEGGYSKQFKDQINKQVGKKISVGVYYAHKVNFMSSQATGYDTQETKTSGLIEGLKENLQAPNIQVYLSHQTDHYGGGIGDTGWGCGYRNLQMLLSSLLRDVNYRTVLKNILNIDNVPSVPKLQELIEKAWMNGYDVSGKEQLGGKLEKTKKWIGTTEVVALLRYCKIRARIVDFHKPTGQGRTHPRLFDWIVSYFKDRCKASSNTPAFPLYLQHEGHSRLCVGCQELLSGQRNKSIFLFDPSHKVNTMKVLLTGLNSDKKSANVKLLRRTLSHIKFDQIQIAFVEGVYDSESEIEDSKIIRSVRIP